MAAKTVRSGPFLGIDTRRPDYSLGVSDGGRHAGDYLRDAVNVDLTNVGTLRRRSGRGTRTVEAATGCRSLWSGDGVTAYYADGGTLYRFPSAAVRAGLTPGLSVSYCLGPDGAVYWSDGEILERIRTVSETIGVTTPAAPTVTPSTGGSLPAGLYMVAVSAVNAAGEESGLTWPVQVTVPANGLITVTGLPVSARVYVSSTNGDLLFLHGSSGTVDDLPDTVGRQPATLGLCPLPAGHIVRWHSGRLLVARDNILYYSEPFAPGLHNPARGYIPFPARISIVAPCEAGVYVVADRTYWLPGGDVEAAPQVYQPLPYGAIEGTHLDDPRTGALWWCSTKGLVAASKDGGAKNVQEDRMELAIESERGAALYRAQDGIRQLIVTLA
ncbi:hypothetical protein [Pseudothauera rhizosphaerae]|uniref:Uncharacterized protein n=1 Tax=Pseudothauera rhizosphaerae TaxID=2565932 RepID=A0A4S4AAH6_9RHOO|nr:hypothetical protein [Pseudothauera rhizosphaerae]THF55907.1 hypothetical protein E6O51_20185 [Pseudothauera rhizosphaerae]